MVAQSHHHVLPVTRVVARIDIGWTIRDRVIFFDPSNPHGMVAGQLACDHTVLANCLGKMLLLCLSQYVHIVHTPRQLHTPKCRSRACLVTGGASRTAHVISTAFVAAQPDHTTTASAVKIFFFRVAVNHNRAARADSSTFRQYSDKCKQSQQHNATMCTARKTHTILHRKHPECGKQMCSLIYGSYFTTTTKKGGAPPTRYSNLMLCEAPAPCEGVARGGHLNQKVAREERALPY